MVGERGRVGVFSHLFLQEIWFSLLFSHFPSCLILVSLFLFNKQYFFRLSLTILLIAKSSIANAIINHSSLEFIILKYNAAVWTRRWHPTPVLFCLENSMDRGAWQAAVHGVAKSPTRLSDFTFTFHSYALEKEMAIHSSALAWRIPWTGGAWWAAVYGVAQSQTRLKQLSSSSSCSFVLGNDLVCFIYVLCFLHSFSWGSHAFSILLFIPTGTASGDWWKLCWNFLCTLSLF